MKLDIARFVNTVDVAKTGSNRKIRGDWGEGLVNREDIFGLGVEGVVVNRFVVNAILLATGDTNLLQSS